MSTCAIRPSSLFVRAAIAAAAILLACRLTSAEDRRKVPARLRVMTFNTKFMWDGQNPEEGDVAFAWKHSPTLAARHMADLARVIKLADADLVHLVEVENLDAVKLLNDKFLEGLSYKPYFVQGTDTATGQDVALLARVDPERGKIDRDDGEGRSGAITKGVSKNYYARFSIRGHQLALIGLHFLSRPTDDERRNPRQAQADLIGRRAEQLASEGREVIVLGDFNDYDGDVPDVVGSRPITNVLWRVKRMNADDPNDDLLNVAALLPQRQRFTAFYDKNDDNRPAPGEHTSIDHILVSPGLGKFVKKAVILQVFNPLQVSDHYPVMVQLELPEVEPPKPRPTSVLITRLLPNPPGDDTDNEEATLQNVGEETVDLKGFTLRDPTGQTWILDALGKLEAGASATIKRNGQAMSLNNSGDIVELVAPDGRVLQKVEYQAIGSGEYVSPAK